MIKLGEGIVNHPEDVSVDGNGVLYTTTGDGWIKRMHPNGTWEDWQQGLLKVSEEGVTVLVSQFNGSQLRYKFWFANDVIEASDGSLYFTVSSTKFTPAEYYLDLVSGEPHGVLLKYDPSTNQTSLVLDGLYFANGVALSEDERFLVVCESWKFRCVKHFLKVSGRTDREIFIDNLPGGPDNVNLARDGSFWISIIKMDPKGIQALQSCKESTQLLEAYPELIQLLIPMGKQAAAAVVNVKADGRLNREISDPNATDISFVTSAQGHDNNLYLASINSDFIGKLPLRPL
ncbi:Str synth domain-containing protein [Citrus sinensis]|uniref:Str synth domain-containing protein n=1 Tax=Citrus sinensis TaxID=2711 RepID=A0ACB8P4C1_CITSI|nr:Str synth domain-containing protein [Citrus sinensis]